MGILDGLMNQLTDNADVSNLAAKVGLSPEHVQSAVQALAKFHPMDVDTAEALVRIADGRTRCVAENAEMLPVR